MTTSFKTERYLLDGRTYHRHQHNRPSFPARPVADLYEMCDDCEEVSSSVTTFQFNPSKLDIRLASLVALQLLETAMRGRSVRSVRCCRFISSVENIEIQP